MSDPAIVRLADNTLLLVQELRNSTQQFGRNVEALRTSVEAMNSLRRELHDGNAEHAEVLRSIDHRLGNIVERLAVIKDDVDDVQVATREATGAHALAAIDPKVKLLREFGALDRFTKVLIAGALVAGGGIGVFIHWIAARGGH